MTIITSVGELRGWLADHDRERSSVGLVPTMGFLHAGHASLIRRAASENDLVVVSDFVNPTQFGVGEDYASYPRDMDHDDALASSAGADVVFAPSVDEMYPKGAVTQVEVTGEITHKLCGATRPIHFRGVTTVVTKLLNIVGPDRVYFGQKDAQQAVVVSRMIRDLHVPVQMVVCPIVRDTDGLALSSRNNYLSPEERRQAPALHAGLKAARERFEAGERSVGTLREVIRATIEAQPLASVEYVEVVDAHELSELDRIGSGQLALAAVAVHFGGTRLIDNCLLGEGGR